VTRRVLGRRTERSKAPVFCPELPTQSERTAATRGALLDAARELFALDGYAATSLDAVVARAAVTKGALYHHFSGKPQIFRAVFDREQQRLARTVAEAYTRRRDPWDGFNAGCRAFLEASLDPQVQRITMLDAPGVLGFATLREAESSSMRLLEEGLRAAMASGRLARRPVEPLAVMLFGALCEAALSIARAENQRAAHRKTVAELQRLLDALAAAP